MSYVSILEDAIETNEKIQKKQKKKSLQNDIIKILENFIREKGLVCYGGIAINSILPSSKKFYDKQLDIPDYDFFSPNALEDAKELALLYARTGYENVEAKSALFHGTYKVFVNFIPIADITYLDTTIFNIIKNKAIIVKNILYAPPSYLRMSLYQELSRPYGDLSRWQKIYNRLTLLNETHPFQYDVDLTQNNLIYNNVYNKLVDICTKQKYILFGDFGLSFYKDYFPNKYKKIIDSKQTKQIYILSDNYKNVLKQLKSINYTLIPHEGDYKFINSFYEVVIEGQSMLYIFTTNSCQSFNIIKHKGKSYHIATIDTILSIYYAFNFINESTINMVNILSYCYLLESIHSNNKTNVLRRFYLPCIGHQITIEDIRKERDQKYTRYKKNKKNDEYKRWFLKYYPKTRKKKS